MQATLVNTGTLDTTGKRFRCGLLALAALVCSVGPARALERPAALRFDVDGTVSIAVESSLRLPSSVAVDLSELETRLFADASDGRLDQHTLMEAALVASGVATRAELDALVRRFDERLADWRRGGLDSLPTTRRVAMLFELMHADLLGGGYRSDCSDLAELLQAGRFNCVSATVIWQCLAEFFDLDSIALESPGHVHAQIIVDGRMIELETTCPQWFEILDDPAKQQAARGRVGAGAPPSRRALTSVGLLAALYYNRGIELLERRLYAEAVAANAKALRLDPDSTIAHGNLLAVLNNWALDLGSQGDFERATHLLAESRQAAPDHETFAINYVAVHQQWIDRLIAEQRLVEAHGLARRLEVELPQERFFRDIQVDIRNRRQR